MFESRGWRLWVYICVSLVAMLATLCAGRVVRCACSTQHCRSTGSNSCTTQYMCYTQYLDKLDGSNPLTTGCISGNTPLLCENRLPAVNHTKWPYLVCCDFKDMCNSGPIPSPPPWGTGNPNSSDSTSEWNRGPGSALGSSFTLANQPIVLAVLTVGMFLLVVITGFGCYELRRQSRFLQQQALARGGYTRAQEEEPSCLVDNPETRGV